ncbi:methyl-accepting chemotaxis sensory transducer, class 34H, partial [Candidatus Magnetobacterium bavaricum]
EQINKAIQQLDMVIQQNAAAAEEMSTTSEELSAQATQMQNTIGFFKIADDDRLSRQPEPVQQKRQRTRVVPSRMIGNDRGSELKKHLYRTKPDSRTLLPGTNLRLNDADRDAQKDSEFEHY